MTGQDRDWAFVAIRLAKVVLVLSASLFCLLVGYNNVVDYGSNFMFVQHVLSMDTTFPDNAVRAGRAIADPSLHHLFYSVIIACELLLGLMLLAGAVMMLRAIGSPGPAFNRAKGLAVLGLAGGVAFWFVAFLVVGGEWFQMWQSSIWNGQEFAFRFVGSIGIIMIFVAMHDE